MTPTETRPPRTWEYVASAVATAIATAVAIVSENQSELAILVKHLEPVPGWLRAVVSLPEAVWWGITAIAGVLLFWIGTRLARRWGTAALLIAPAVMLVLTYVIPWILYAPIRAALPSISG